MYLKTVSSTFPPFQPQSYSLLTLTSKESLVSRIIDSTYPYQARKYCRALTFVVCICLKSVSLDAKLEMGIVIQAINGRAVLQWNLKERPEGEEETGKRHRNCDGTVLREMSSSTRCLTLKKETALCAPVSGIGCSYSQRRGDGITCQAFHNK